ncbi:hypothetical protein BHE74_00014233 [Ensete ventricosum]|nr:hypothetical protein BHE74_00014233 [Ensete ventricosum]
MHPLQVIGAKLVVRAYESDCNPRNNEMAGSLDQANCFTRRGEKSIFPNWPLARCPVCSAAFGSRGPRAFIFVGRFSSDDSTFRCSQIPVSRPIRSLIGSNLSQPSDQACCGALEATLSSGPGSEHDEREVRYSPRAEEAQFGAPIGKRSHKERLSTVETCLDVLEASLEELYQGQGRLLGVESSQEEAESRIDRVESLVDRLTEDTEDSVRHLHEVVAELTAKLTFSAGFYSYLCNCELQS